jgi:hypothetical protein
MACSRTSGDGGELNEFERPGSCPGDLDPPSPPVVLNTAEILKMRWSISASMGAPPEALSIRERSTATASPGCKAGYGLENTAAARYLCMTRSLKTV